MKHLFFYIGAAALILLLVLEIYNVGYDANNSIIASARLSIAGKAVDFLDKIRDAIPFGQDDPLFEPLNLERFRLADGELDEDKMFIWYAFYDTRDPLGPRIRILANVVCRDFKREDLMVDIGEGAPLPLEWAEVLGSAGCAGGGGGHCRLQEMELSTIVYKGNVPDQITLMRKGNQVNVNLMQMPTNYKEAINSCIIAPLFWYNDWPRLFLFFEWWKRNRINKILLHIHSISKEAKQVIDHYVDEGLVEVRPFPLMPFTSKYNPNNHVYYSAEHLTTFFCAVWSDSKYTTMNDVDEIFYVRNRNETLLDVARRRMDSIKHPDIGAIWLEHHALGFPGGLTSEPWNFEVFKRFDSIRQAVPYRQGRAGKYIYQTQYAKRPWIHGMRGFYGNKRDEQVSNEEVVYLHMRKDNINVSSKPRLFPDFQMFDEVALAEMELIIEEIFEGEPPPFNTPKTMPLVESCLQRTLLEIPRQDCIKPTGPICYEALKDQDQWLYAVPTDDSHFVPL